MSKHQKHKIFFIVSTCLLLFALLYFNISIGWLILWFVCNLLVLVYGVVNLQFNYFFTSTSSAPTSKSQIAITFDDGPAHSTLKILELLKENGAKATFFCIGKNIENNEFVAKKIFAEGHTLANHTHTHSHLFDFYSSPKIIEELTHCNAAIFNAIGKKPLLFRPPNGISNPMIAKALKTTNHCSIAWDVRTFDTFYKNTDDIYNRVVSKIKPGSIILMHDTMPHTYYLASKLINHCKEKGWELVTVDELLKIKAYE